MTKIIAGEGLIVIDGERLGVERIRGEGYLPEIETEGGEFVVAESSEEAGKAARLYWKELAEHDPQELACIVGEKNLVAWALGQSAGPGSTAVRSLEEWLDLWLDAPQENWATWDGQELDIDAVTQDIADDLGWSGDFDAVAYRHN